MWARRGGVFFCSYGWLRAVVLDGRGGGGVEAGGGLSLSLCSMTGRFRSSCVFPSCYVVVRMDCVLCLFFFNSCFVQWIRLEISPQNVFSFFFC